MSFQEGDSVLIRSLKKRGVVQKCLRDSRFRVAVNQMSITCREEDLDPVSPSKGSSAGRHRGKKKLPSSRVREIDLHGYTVERARESVLEFINRAILDEESRLHIIHGHGSGKVKEGVHTLLSSLDVIRHFEVSQANSGVTVVYLS
jgi:DNA mismatch repair protein MutS2